MPVELPSGYHLKNFLSLLRFVRSHYRDLLSPEELAYADDFEKLSSQEQSLYVRMVLRKGPVFRSDKLNYSDVDDIVSTGSILVQSGFVDNEADEDEILALHTKSELTGWIANKGAAKQLKRDELLSFIKTELEVLKQPLPFEVYRPLGTKILQLFRLLFFGNLNQDFTEFVLTDMGMLHYEKYLIPEAVRLFNSRDAIEQTWQLYELREAFNQIVELDDVDKLAEYATDLEFFNSEITIKQSGLVRRWDRLFNDVARQLERCHFYDEALRLYTRSQSSPSRERQARIMKKQGDDITSLEICHSILAQPVDENELEFATRFAHQLSKKLYGKSDVKQTTLEYETISLVLKKTVSHNSVEESVRLWCESNSNRCFYVENTLVPGLFGLCFWDIMFESVKGAFVNPYQRGPLDLFTPDFYLVRNKLITSRIEELKEPGKLSIRVYNTIASKKGIANYFVQWEQLTDELVRLALDRIPHLHFVAMFSRLLFDLRNNRSGFPDLISFPTEIDANANISESYEMIEVKGPGDQLQNNQKRWIKAFKDNGIPFKLAKVQWAD